MKIIAVDLGNYNINTSEGIMFSSTFREFDVETQEIQDILEFEGKKYQIGVGEYDLEYNKSIKNYMPNLLYAIAKSTDEDEIGLILNVPADSTGIKEKYKEDLEGKTFNYNLDGVNRTVTIKKIGTVAEGLGSFYTLRKDVRQQDTIMLDFGGRTCNVCVFRKGKLVKKFTVEKGMLDIVNSVKVRENNNGSNYSLERMAELVRDGKRDTTVENINYIKTIENSLKLNITGIEDYNIYATGGGSIDLEIQLKDIFKNLKLVDDPLFSNVNGNKKIAEMKWK